MKNVKKLPVKQLEKFSTIFTQLGLVLVLFIVHLTFEYQTEKKSVATIQQNDSKFIYVEPNQIVIFKKEEIPTPKSVTKKVQKLILDDIEKGDDKIIETIIEAPKLESTELNPDDIIEVKIPGSDPIIETVPFINIENAPIFKGCEGLSKEKNKECFNEKMKKHVQRYFDADLANAIGLQSGKYRISTQFIIDDKGNIVDVQIRAPHHKLEKEAQELIEKLPKFTPGKQSKKAVKVKYTLPISFKVD